MQKECRKLFVTLLLNTNINILDIKLLVPKLKNDLGFGSTEFFVLRSNTKRMLPRLLFHITKSKDFREKAEKAMTGASGHRRVPKSFVESYPIPDIPISKQQKIVSEIENIENKISDLQNQLDRIPEKKKEALQKYL